MNQKISYQLVIPVLLTLLVIAALGIFLPRLIGVPGYQIGPVTSTGSLRSVSANTFDSTLAGELSAMRWQAKAEQYLRIGAVPSSAVAGELSGLRWNAKAKAYQQLLSKEPMDAGELSGLRWNAKAKAYQRD